MPSESLNVEPTIQTEVRRKLWRGATHEEREVSAAALHEEEKPIVADLRHAGLDVQSVWDLVNWRGPPYDAAIPVLLKHLPIYYSDRLAEGIARALSRPYARAASWEAVLSLFRTEPQIPGAGFKDALALALSGMAKSKDIEVLMELFRDKSHGGCRVFFISKIARSKHKDAMPTLARHLDDPSVRNGVEDAIKRKLKREYSSQKHQFLYQ